MSSEIFGSAECDIIHFVNCEISPFGRCEIKFVPLTREAHFTAAGNFTLRRSISLVPQERISVRARGHEIRRPPSSVRRSKLRRENRHEVLAGNLQRFRVTPDLYQKQKEPLCDSSDCRRKAFTPRQKPECERFSVRKRRCFGKIVKSKPQVRLEKSSSSSILQVFSNSCTQK